VRLADWLKRAKTEIDSLDAELIAVHALNFKDRTEVILNENKDYDTSKLDVMLVRRKTGLPLAYILKKKEFYGRDFYVDQNVLIPRVETEQIVTEVLDIVAAEKMLEPTIIDIGTGSGCIPITIKLELKQRNLGSRVFGTDISKNTLEVAKLNAERLMAGVTFYESDLLAQVEGLPDIMTANLPYVDVNWDFLSPNLKYEPALALYAGDGGLKLIKQLFDQISAHKKDEKKRFLIIEADVLQNEAIIKYASERGFKLIAYQKYMLGFSY